MGEQRDEAVTPKTGIVEPVEVTVAVENSNHAVSETVHVAGVTSYTYQFTSC